MITPMNADESSTFVDWINVSLRWLLLLALTVAAAINGNLPFEVILTLLVAALWNVSLTLLATINRRLWAHRYMLLAGDVIIASLLFLFSGGLQGSLGWVGVLPLLTSALYFRILGGLLGALGALLFQGLMALVVYQFMDVLAFLIPLLPIYLGVGILMGGLSGRLTSLISQTQRDLISANKKSQRAERERNRAIYNLISALNASLNYQRVLETALDLGYSTLAKNHESENRMVSSVLLYTKINGNDSELKVGAARRFTTADMRISLPGTTGLIGETIDRAESQLTSEVSNDPELSRIVAVRTCRSAYCIPLFTGLDTYGVLLFAHPDSNYFTSERCEILDIIGNQAIVAMQNARLYHELELEKERMMEIQEEARKKLARDLHDGPTQSVSALAMRVNFTRRVMERDPGAAAEELYKIEELARRATKEIRHMLFTLRPLILESQGLVAALESMADKMRETYNQNVLIEADPEIVSQIDPNRQGVLFYIAEEAVNNARKHAQASNIWVRIKASADDFALLVIEDDGVGFDLVSVDSSYNNRDSLGMLNMRERTELINGKLKIEASEGKGTLIQVLIPLDEDAAERIRLGQ